MPAQRATQVGWMKVALVVAVLQLFCGGTAWAQQAPPWSSRSPLTGSAAPTLRQDFQVIISAQAMAALPAASWHAHARAAAQGGLGLAVGWRLQPQHALRLGATWSWARFAAAQAQLSGHVDVVQVMARGDYIFGTSWWRPYAGLGVGLAPYGGRITERTTGLANSSNDQLPLLGSVVLGVDLNLISNFSIAPEAGWTIIGGGFNAAIWQAGLALRWEA